MLRVPLATHPFEALSCDILKMTLEPVVHRGSLLIKTISWQPSASWTLVSASSRVGKPQVESAGAAAALGIAAVLAAGGRVEPGLPGLAKRPGAAKGVELSNSGNL